ncbi:MAG: DUF4260 domain-containing protein [Methylovirgula sp.]|nr:DUF4260 domain-containing protein [Methylovirgula sp.]
MQTVNTPTHYASHSDASPSGAATGTVALLLRLEGGLVFAASIVAYWRLDGNWWLFLLLLLAPDISMVGYLRGPRIGALSYNSVHTYLVPALLAGWAWLFHAAPLPYLIGAIWCAHIGLDRLLGFGLKYPEGFGFTHLGVLRRHDENASPGR